MVLGFGVFGDLTGSSVGLIKWLTRLALTANPLRGGESCLRSAFGGRPILALTIRPLLWLSVGGNGMPKTLDGSQSPGTLHGIAASHIR